MSEWTSPHRSRARWRERFLATTRGRLLVMLRQEPSTPADLGERLGISPNAVRAHLSSLARDGLVESGGVRREGVGKPPRVYRATAAAEELFPKAYEAVLSGLLERLEDGVGRERLGALLEGVGRDAARATEVPGEPLDRALGLLRELGAEVEARDTAEGLELEGHACPLGALVGRWPELCRMLSVLLEEVTGGRVRERCRRDDPERPRCAFLVTRR